MVSFESAYVALNRMKQQAQVYTDNREKWVAAMEKSQAKSTAHDILEPRGDRAVVNAARQRARWRNLSRRGANTRNRTWRCRPSTATAGVWLSALTSGNGQFKGLGGEGRVMGSEDAAFAGLQTSRNGESLLAVRGRALAGETRS